MTWQTRCVFFFIECWSVCRLIESRFAQYNAFSQAFPNVTHVVSEWGQIFLFCVGGKLFRLEVILLESLARALCLCVFVCVFACGSTCSHTTLYIGKGHANEA